MLYVLVHIGNSFLYTALVDTITYWSVYTVSYTVLEDHGVATQHAVST